MSDSEEKFLIQVRHEKLPEPERELKFNTGRKWRIDFAWPELMLAVEIEGGTWSGGRHTRGAGFRKDCEKYNQMILDGWTLLRFTSGMVTDGEAIKTTTNAIELKKEGI